jgi:hypothetical protein
MLEHGGFNCFATGSCSNSHCNSNMSDSATQLGTTSMVWFDLSESTIIVHPRVGSIALARELLFLFWAP